MVSCNKTDIFSVKEIEGEFTDYKGDVIYAVYENFESGIITDTIYLDNLKFKKNLKLNDSSIETYCHIIPDIDNKTGMARSGLITTEQLDDYLTNNYTELKNKIRGLGE